MSAPFRFTANHDVAVIGDPELWQEARRRAGDLPELEAWLERADGQALAILASGDRAWLMHIPAPGAAGWTTRNPALSRSEDAVSFVLANGQSDSYPLAWTYARAEALLAAEYFIDHGGRAPWMEWHDDTSPDAPPAGPS